GGGSAGDAGEVGAPLQARGLQGRPERHRQERPQQHRPGTDQGLLRPKAEDGRARGEPTMTSDRFLPLPRGAGRPADDGERLWMEVPLAEQGEATRRAVAYALELAGRLLPPPGLPPGLTVRLRVPYDRTLASL